MSLKKILLSGILFRVLVAGALAQHPTIGGYNVYYGNLHNHSNVSDGIGTPATAYNYAKNSAFLDFFSLSDHSGSISSEEWTDLKNQANAANQDGIFTAFYGFEWSSTGVYGHVTVINTDDYCTTSSQTESFEGLVNWISSFSDGIAFFNHPGREDGNGLEFNHFTTSPSDQVVGIELWNRGDAFSSFYYNDGYFSGDNNKSYYDEANNRGWRVGAMGADDNHSGTWGTEHPFRMAILSNNLTRSELLQAMHARRFFSTLDFNLALSFKINGMEMGSLMTEGNYKARIMAADADGELFNQVILFNRNHDIVNMWYLNKGSVDLSVNLNASAGEYYYVKVKQVDGDEAISSPVWISGSISNQHPDCSITSPSNGTTLTYPANIEINADATDADGSISVVEFYQGTIKLGEDFSSPYSFVWNNVTKGSYCLTVKAIDNSGATSSSSAVYFDVTSRSITIMADPIAKTYGSSDPALTYRIISGSLAGTDSFGGNLTRNTGETVGAYSIEQGTLALNSNYIITYLESSFTITARPITVTADPRTKMYGDSDPVLTHKITSGALVGTDSFTGVLSRTPGEDVGAYIITPGTLELSNNYTLKIEKANLEITPRPITVTADPKTKMYGDADPSLTHKITSGALVGTDSFTGVLSRTHGEDVGAYTITPGTLGLSNNYTLKIEKANFEITARLITVTADPKTKVYGDADPVLTHKITSGTLVGTDTFTGVLSRTPGEDIGTYTITPGTLGLSNNYALMIEQANLEIIARPITVTADSRSKVYGDPDPKLTYKITSGSLAGTDSFNGYLIRDPGEDVGTYAINQGDLALTSNYDLAFKRADFRITAHFEMNVYPNPFTNHIFFDFELNNKASISIDFFNLSGEKIATVFSGNVEADSYHFGYIPDHMAKGILIYRLTIDGRLKVKGKAIHY